MYAIHRITILRDAGDAGLAALLRQILEGISKEQRGTICIQDLCRAGLESLRNVILRVRADLTIVILPPDGAFSCQDLLAVLKSTPPRRPLLAVLPENRTPDVLQLLNSGVSDYIVPPIRPWDLIPRVLHLLRVRESEDELIAHLKQMAGLKEIVGQSPLFLAQLHKLPVLAGCDATVLISGETGTGKELFARAIHYLSRRSNKPFVAADSGAIPPDLFENELFGHERGAYTSAPTAQQGLIQESEGGTLFLDEIDALSVTMQSKILRFLQEKEYRPLGSSKTRHANVRVIVASNISLEEAMRAGRFRQDLFFRLNVLTLQIPPLRDRPEDIPVLARHFLKQYATEFFRPARDLTDGALTRLLRHPFRGNVRELENLIQRAVLSCDGGLIDSRDIELPSSEPANDKLRYQARKHLMVTNWEEEELKRMLTMFRGNLSAIAKQEGKDPSALRALLRKHHLRSDRSSPYWNIRA